MRPSLCGGTEARAGEARCHGHQVSVFVRFSHRRRAAPASRPCKRLFPCSPAICLSGELHCQRAHALGRARTSCRRERKTQAARVRSAGEGAWGGMRGGAATRDPAGRSATLGAAAMPTFLRLPAPPGGHWGRAGSRNNASGRTGRGAPGSPASPGHSAAHRLEPPPLASSSLFPRLLIAEGL